jgi:hypothetical protein
MDEIAFWSLIDHTRLTSQGDQPKQGDLLIQTLAQYPIDEILAWGEIFESLMDQAYVAELWEVASLIECGCSDDGFMDFRAWLIGLGKDTFEKVLINSENLVDIVEVGQEEQVGVSSLWYVTIGAYELKTGKGVEQMPKRRNQLPELQGTHSADKDVVLARFPRTTARFWKRCMDMFACTFPIAKIRQSMSGLSRGQKRSP